MSDLENQNSDVEAMELDVISPLEASAEPDAEGACAIIDDEGRPEATFRFIVNHLSTVSGNIFSPPCYVRNLPWKILVMPRGSQEKKTLGYYVQCNGGCGSSGPAWSVSASAELRLISHEENVEPFTRKIKHVFNNRENDWGFNTYMSFADLTEKGYVKDDALILEVRIVSDIPSGIKWDSKKQTGYLGLKNQGATCYMNSLLQTLYFTNPLRKALYKMPTVKDECMESVTLALQRVFYDLQFSDKPVDTRKLTKSFGWERQEVMTQHDVQEFLRLLLDLLETNMIGTCVEGTIPKLFEGTTLSYIKCKNVDYTSTRLEKFYDVQLNIVGKKNIYESFQDYISTESLEGANKYDAGEHGLQEAKKGAIFITLPTCLHLHLLRFMYSAVTDRYVKFNDKFEFYEKINLDPYLQTKEETSAVYTLHAVLVHIGTYHSGHYVVYINPKGDGKWFKFDDEAVSRCTKEEAIDFNFGGQASDDPNKYGTSAYMLVYVKDSELQNVLQDVTVNDIPEELNDLFQGEKKMEEIILKELSEAHLYMQVNVILEEDFQVHQGNDLCDMEKVQPRKFRILKLTTLQELMEILSETFNYPVEQLRIWPFNNRSNQSIRPISLDVVKNWNRGVFKITENRSPWIVFLEMLQPNSEISKLPDFDHNKDVLLFFKLYDPDNKKTRYYGHRYVPMSSQVDTLIPVLNKKAGFPLDTKLVLYEEVENNVLKPLNNMNIPLEKAFGELMDGDIVVFQKAENSNDAYKSPNRESILAELLHRVEVIFFDKTNPNDPGCTMTLSLKMTYEQMALAVAERLGTDSHLLQFFKYQHFKSAPGPLIEHTFKGTLKDLIVLFQPVKKLYYQRLTVRIDELGEVKQFKCVWVGSDLKEEKELILCPSKRGSVLDLLEEAKKQVQLSPEGTGKLRIFEVHKCKIGPILKENIKLETLNPTGGPVKVYRIEEIPKEDMDLLDKELLIPVAHFDKEISSTFGIPFLLKVQHGESFAIVMDKIFRRLHIQEKEFRKYRLAIVTSKCRFIDYSSNFCIDVNEIRRSNFKPWLGLEHANETFKKSVSSYMEKAVKLFK